MRGVAQGNPRTGRGAFLLVVVLGMAFAAGGAQAAGGTAVNANVEGVATLSADAQGASAATQGLDAGLPVEGVPAIGLRVPVPAPSAPAPSAPALPLRLNSVGAWSPVAGDVLAQPAVQVGAGLSLIALMALALRGLAFAPLAPLYSRLDAQGLLEHPTRRELLRIISEEPGVNISDLHGRLDMGWGSLLYHLQRLEAQGLVQSHRWGRSRRYFLNERSVSVRAAAIRALKAQNARALAEEIAQSPGATQEQLATTLGVSKSVVSKYAQRLEQVSLVERQVGRNCLRLFPKQELRELLHTLPEAAPRLPAPHVGLPPAVTTADPPAEGNTA